MEFNNWKYIYRIQNIEYKKKKIKKNVDTYERTWKKIILKS